MKAVNTPQFAESQRGLDSNESFTEAHDTHDDGVPQTAY